MANTNKSAGEAIPSAFSLFQPSSERVQRNATAYLGVSLAPAIIFAFVGVLGRNDSSLGLASSLYGIGFLYTLVMLAASPFLQLETAKGNEVSFGEAVRGSFPYYWRIFGLYIVLGFLIVFGLILLVVPGIIMIRRYFLAPYYLIDKNTSIGEAMSASAAATKNRSGAVWGVIGTYVLLSLPGLVPVIGSLIASILQILYSCAAPFRYLQLSKLPPKA